MACFLVPAAEALVTAAVTKAEERKEEKMKAGSGSAEAAETVRIPFSRKLHWLSCLLFGGSFLLMFEHLWHGEVVPWFPFLTAAADPADAAAMLHEMATAGVLMAVLVTAAWAVICLAADSLVRKEARERALQTGGAR